ncbi:hypothetical protein [Devosia alba]|uniref:hypothetical protein n=1 Tax=Devosia alba TaxID=3152360 RepID=UPI003267AC1B
MNEAVTFDEADWRQLTGHDKKALRTLARVSIDFEPLAKASGVGQKSMDALIAKDLTVEGAPSLHGRTFKITKKGWLAVEWLQGRRTRVYPES